MKTQLILFIIFILNFGLLQGQKVDDVDKLVENKNYDEALTLVEDILGDETIEFDSLKRKTLLQTKYDILHKKSLTFLRSGKLLEAEKCVEASKNAIEKEYNKNDKYYTRSLNTLGYIYRINGQFKKAERTYKLAKKLKEKRFEIDKQYSKILNNLGGVLIKLNNFHDAEACIDRSLKIKEDISGPTSLEVAKVLFQKTILFQSTGRYSKALVYIEKALQILEQAQDKSEILKYKQLKSTLLYDLERYDEALLLYQDIKTDLEGQGLGSGSDYAKLLMSFSNVYAEKGQLDTALDYAEQSKGVFEVAHGSSHPYFGLALRNLGNLMLEAQKTDDLEAIFQKSSQITSKKYGKKHIEYFISEFSLFRYYKKNGDVEMAIEVLENIDEIISNHITNASKYLSIKEIHKLTRMYDRYYSELLSLTAANTDNDFLVETAMNNTLFFKGFILRSLLEIRKTIDSSKDIADLSDELTTLNLQLENAFSRTDRDSETIEQLQQKISELDADMNRKIGSINREISSAEWEDVQYSLTDEEVIIQFVKFEDPQSQLLSYGALLIAADYDRPKFIELFAEKKITTLFEDRVVNSNALISTFYGNSQNQSSDSRGAEGFVKELTSNGVSLHDLIIEPIKEELENYSTVFYSCEGILHNIALHAVEYDEENIMIDKFSMQRLTSLNQLVDDDYNFDNYSKTSLLVGDVDYGTLITDTSMRGSRNRGGWSTLQWTKSEIKNISEILEPSGFSIDMLSASAANEENYVSKVNSNDGYSIMHFATHGYFDTDDLLNLDSSNQRLDALNSMTNSSLVLAGANTLEVQGEDSYITAYEISQSNLKNTQLVVLSACETGLGHVKENEGVYGLQRAFKIAGVEYIIMSLWQIPDQESMLFMTAFYKNYVESGSDIFEAFNTTQKQIKEQFPDPFYWAGFVLVK